jgi:hypothetical protein
MADELGTKTLAETENYVVWTSEEDGETIYHVELGQVSLHLILEEWQELLSLIDSTRKSAR